MWRGVHLSDVAQRLRAEFPEEAKAGWGDICRDVGLSHCAITRRGLASGRPKRLSERGRCGWA
eukprot:8445908-Alexandrium_andersonii.AAC.1